MTERLERLRFRADTAANWTAIDPVLGLREPAVEIDTGKLKIGDGSTPWSGLEYVSKGDPGPPGEGLHILDVLTSTAELPASGEPGDGYIVDGDLWVWAADAGAWENAGPLRGEKGDPGQVQSVNGDIGPDVVLDAADVGAETPAGAQSKADAAETAANDYTDTEVAGALSSANGYTDAEIAALVAAAPGALDTLNELAAALGDDPNFATSITNALAGKLAHTGGTLTGYRETVVVTATSGAVTLNLTAGNVFRLNPTGAVTIAISGGTAGVAQPFTVIVGNSNHAITWPAGTRFPGGSPPTLDGETWISGVRDENGALTVGAAWAAVAT